VGPFGKGSRGAAPIRVLYADLDGTLLGPGGSLFATAQGPSSRAADALAALHRASVWVVLVSGRTRSQLREVARIVGAAGYIAELGAFVVERDHLEEVTPNLGSWSGPGTPFEAMVRSGAGAFLLERYRGRLEPHAPWAFQDREATMLFRGLIDEREATDVLLAGGYRWLEVCDNGRMGGKYDSLRVPEVHAYHLVPRGVSKAAAVRLHRERAGLRREEAAAVGDSPSDAEMASEVGAMVLVGGAVDDARRDNVISTSSPAGEGFADAVDVLFHRDRSPRNEA
jgi:3-deoxy-D-manno-octulosonate 8-phosphate phosphatase KdsC-like HAD superfamily phosphatase